MIYLCKQVEKLHVQCTVVVTFCFVPHAEKHELPQPVWNMQCKKHVVCLLIILIDDIVADTALNLCNFYHPHKLKIKTYLQGEC